MRAPVSETAAAEVIPRAPFTLHVLRGVVTLGRTGKPLVPVQALRQFLGLGESRHLAAVLVPAAVIVHVRDKPHDLRGVENLRLDIVAELIEVGLAVALVAHLRDDARPPGLGQQELVLAERMAERLLAEDGETVAHRVHERREMRMVRRHHRDGIGLPDHRIQHLAEVGEPRGVRIVGQRVPALRTFEVRVAQGDNFAETRLLELADVAPRLIADADAREPHPGVRRIAERDQTARREQGKRTGR